MTASSSPTVGATMGACRTLAEQAAPEPVTVTSSCSVASWFGPVFTSTRAVQVLLPREARMRPFG